MSNDFSLAQTIDVDSLKSTYLARGRVEIRDFLAPGQAEQLRKHLVGRNDWMLVLNTENDVYEIPRQAFAQLTDDQKLELDSRVIAAARKGFQYRYESVRVPDDPERRQARDSYLDRFILFMSSPPVLDLIAAITGCSDLNFADGQATAYSPGHFLTAHDDDVAGKRRRAAYVFGLAPQWRAEWGGLLMFHGDDGNIDEAFVPAMGALRLFSVPCQHSVSYVAPLAPEPRLSVTGWFRALGATG